MSTNMKILQSVAWVLTRSFLDLGARLIVHVVGLALFFDEISVKIRDIATSCMLVMTFIPAVLQIKQNEAKHRRKSPLRYLQSTIIFQLGLYAVLMLAVLVQFNIIFPIEQMVVSSGVVSFVSLLFIPFGFKVIFAAFGGSAATVPIFFAHATMDLFFGRSLPEVSLYGVLGAFVVYFPIVLFNFSRERPLCGRLDLSQGNYNIARIILLLAFIATILNSVIHSTIHQGLQIDLLAFRYVTGVLGVAVAVLLLLVAFKRQFIRLRHRLVE